MNRLLIAIFFVLTACSAYESPGRKYLESQGLQFAAGAAAQSSLTACNREVTNANWVLIQKDSRAQVYSSEAEDFTVRVQTTSDDTFNCYYKFNSAQDMFEKSSAAIDLTVEKLNFNPVKEPSEAKD